LIKLHGEKKKEESQRKSKASFSRSCREFEKRKQKIARKEALFTPSQGKKKGGRRGGQVVKLTGSVVTEKTGKKKAAIGCPKLELAKHWKKGGRMDKELYGVNRKKKKERNHSDLTGVPVRHSVGKRGMSSNLSYKKRRTVKNSLPKKGGKGNGSLSE